MLTSLNSYVNNAFVNVKLWLITAVQVLSLLVNTLMKPNCKVWPILSHVLILLNWELGNGQENNAIINNKSDIFTGHLVWDMMCLVLSSVFSVIVLIVLLLFLFYYKYIIIVCGSLSNSSSLPLDKPADCVFVELFGTDCVCLFSVYVEVTLLLKSERRKSCFALNNWMKTAL